MDYDDSNWRNEYIDLCSHRLTKRQIELLEHGPKGLSQAWLVGAMRNDWKRIKAVSYTHLTLPTTPYV